MHILNIQYNCQIRKLLGMSSDQVGQKGDVGMRGRGGGGGYVYVFLEPIRNEMKNYIVGTL